MERQKDIQTKFKIQGAMLRQNKLTNIHIVAWHSVHHIFFPLQSFDGHLNYKCKQPQDNFLASETHQETSGH
jgi:hypothetical protein